MRDKRRDSAVRKWRGSVSSCDTKIAYRLKNRGKDAGHQTLAGQVDGEEA